MGFSSSPKRIRYRADRYELREWTGIEGKGMGVIPHFSLLGIESLLSFLSLNVSKSKAGVQLDTMTRSPSERKTSFYAYSEGATTA